MFDTVAETNSMMIGRVKRVMMLLIAVRVTDKATPPLASMEKTFDELPPGQQATRTSPIKYTGGSFRSHAVENAIIGRRTICPIMPSSTALGLCAISVKAFLLMSMPKRNIMTIRIGITIHMEFIVIYGIKV
jgi:hypothetical protein